MDQNLPQKEFNDLDESKSKDSIFSFISKKSPQQSFNLSFENNQPNQEEDSLNNYNRYYLDNNQNRGFGNQVIQNQEEGALNNEAFNNINNINDNDNDDGNNNGNDNDNDNGNDNNNVNDNNNNNDNDNNNVNDNGNNNTRNTKCLFKLEHNQQLDNNTTRYTTNITNTNIHRIERIENKKEEDKKEIKIKDNTKQDGTYVNRNFPDVFIRNFFINLNDFINKLIIISNETKNTNIELLLYINKKHILKHASDNKLEMLEKKAKDFLTVDLNDIKDQKDEDDIFIYFIERLRNIYNDPKNEEINSVLNHTIQELLDIYREKVEPKEEFYIHFKRFKDHYNNTGKGEEYKEKLKRAGEQFENDVNNKYNNDHKKGPKPKKKMCK
jgi:hypothetical protein